LEWWDPVGEDWSVEDPPCYEVPSNAEPGANPTGSHYILTKIVLLLQGQRMNRPKDYSYPWQKLVKWMQTNC